MITDGHLGGYFHGGDSATYCPHLWKWFIDTMHIKSVMDIGCAEGQSTKFFQDYGCEALGIDGCLEAVKNSVIPITQWDFINGPYIPQHEFDLIWCSEVLEHIEEKHLKNILQTMTYGNILAITAAPPGQGGHHHVNCQPSSYWIEKILDFHFICDAASTRAARAIATIENSQSHFSRNGWIFRKVKYPQKVSNRVSLTFISGDVFANLSGVEVYLKSLDRHWLYDKVVFTHNLNPENRERIQNLGFRIVDVNPSNIKEVVLDRWFNYWKFLCNNDYDIVLITDSKDVLFQGNPCKFTPLGEFLVLCSEGQKHKDSDWNIQEQKKFQEANHLKYEFLDQPVLNGGVQFGSGRKMKDFTYLMYQGIKLSVEGKNISDQAFLNYLYRTIVCDPNVEVADPGSSPFVATGDALKNKTANFRMVYEKGVYYNPEFCTPYCIFHQWDRTEFADQIIGVKQ